MFLSLKQNKKNIKRRTIFSEKKEKRKIHFFKKRKRKERAIFSEKKERNKQTLVVYLVKRTTMNEALFESFELNGVTLMMLAWALSLELIRMWKEYRSHNPLAKRLMKIEENKRKEKSKEETTAFCKVSLLFFCLFFFFLSFFSCFFLFFCTLGYRKSLLFSEFRKRL